MGNIFSYCWNVKDNFRDRYLLKPLTDNDSKTNHKDYSYASFVDSDKDSDNIVLDNINMLNRKIEILEETTQCSLKNISTDIKHIYVEQEEIKKNINSSIYSNKTIKYEITEPIKYEITEPIKYEITEPIKYDQCNQSSMFVNESVYHDFNSNNDNISSEEETY